MRVLIVEDDSATARQIEVVLKKEGFVCDTADRAYPVDSHTQ